MESTLRSRIATAMHLRTEQEVEELLTDSRAWMYRLALAILGCPEAAEDVAQESLIRAAKSPQLRLINDPKPWLRKVLVRRAISALSERKPERLSEHLQIDDPSATIAVQATLGRLSPLDRSMLALWHFEGLTYDEMARVLDIPSGTVASRLNNAREAFRKEWAK